MPGESSIAIKFDVTPYVDFKGKQPRGHHLWRFSFLVEGSPPKGLNIDGDWLAAKKQALRVAKDLRKRDVVIEVHPY